MNKNQALNAVARVTDAALIGGACMGVWEPLVATIAVSSGIKKVQKHRAQVRQDQAILTYVEAELDTIEAQLNEHDKAVAQDRANDPSA